MSVIRYSLFLLLGTFSWNCFGGNQLPNIYQCNVEIQNNAILVEYELDDIDNTNLEVRCKVYFAGGTNRNQPVMIQGISGDIGFPVNRGTNKKIRIELINPSNLQEQLNIVLSAYDREPLDINEFLAQVDQSRILNELNTLQGKRNEQTDNTFKNQCRKYITDQIIFKTPINIFESKIAGLTNINYEITHWGTEKPDLLQVIDAHYDSYSNAPGADDNASGVVGVLEAYRILGKLSCKKSIRFIFFDLEENGLIGSNLYVRNQLPSLDTIENVINFEMIGYYSDVENTQDLPTGFNILFPEAYNEVISNGRRGNFIINVGNSISKSLIQAFSDASKNYVNNLRVINLEVPGNGSLAPDLRRSDHANFWDKNIKALMITDGANFRNKNYHTVKDSVHYLNMDFMSSVIKASIATLISLAGAEHGTSVSIPLKPAVGSNDIYDPFFSLLQLENNLIINFQNTEHNKSVQLIDMNGHITNFSSYADQIVIPTIQFTSGIYYLNITEGSKKQIQKILVSNMK